MATDIQEKAITRHLRDYGQLIQAEAEKLEILGIETTPSLFDKAREIYFLADQISSKPNVLHKHFANGEDGAVKPQTIV
jgi:hypothetical protein